MKKLVLISFISIVSILGVNDNSSINYVNDGNVNDQEANQMQQAWCEYNQGQDFAASQCN